MSRFERFWLYVCWLLLTAVLGLYALAVVVHHRNIAHLRHQPPHESTR